MTDAEIKAEKAKIDKMSQIELCSLARFAKAGHPYFSSDNPELCMHFNRAFIRAGGMTATISKRLGWT